MTQFKVGDKVVRFRDPYCSGNVGVEGVVTRMYDDDDGELNIYVSYDGTKNASSYVASNFKLAEPKPQPHKHAEVIKAWADGAEIEVKDGNKWHDCTTPMWVLEHEYRVKPEPEPDTFQYITVGNVFGVQRFTELDDARSYIRKEPEAFTILKLTYDGETGKVKAREIVQ